MKRIFMTWLEDRPGPQKLKIGEATIVLARQNDRTPQLIDVWYESDAAYSNTEFEMEFEVIQTIVPVSYDHTHMISVILDGCHIRHIYRKEMTAP